MCGGAFAPPPSVSGLPWEAPEAAEPPEPPTIAIPPSDGRDSQDGVAEPAPGSTRVGLAKEPPGSVEEPDLNPPAEYMRYDLTHVESNLRCLLRPRGAQAWLWQEVDPK